MFKMFLTSQRNRLPGRTKAAHFLFILYGFTSITGYNLPPSVYICLSPLCKETKVQHLGPVAASEKDSAISGIPPNFLDLKEKSVASGNSQFCNCSFLLNMNLPKFYMLKIYYKIYIVSYSSKISRCIIKYIQICL